MSAKLFVRIGNDLIRLDYIREVELVFSLDGKSSSIFFNYQDTENGKYGKRILSEDDSYHQALAVYNYIQSNMVIDLNLGDGDD